MGLAWGLLLFVLEAGDEHLLGPLGGLQVVLQDAPEEVHQLLIAILLGVLDVGLQRLHVVGGVVEHGDEVVVLVLWLPRRFGHLPSRRWVALLGSPRTRARPSRKRGGARNPEAPLMANF